MPLTLTETLSRAGNPTESDGFRLWHRFLGWQRSLSASLLALGLTQPLFSVLAVIGWLTREGGAVTQQRIANVSGMDRMHISGLVRKLEAMGLVTRTPSQRDRRAVAVSLTPEGRDTLARAIPAAADHDAAFFASAPERSARR
ncbi:MarR family winged helix-turn-helix transcriptional regulator [Vannielia litorea]|uniref:DNA-binding transcriptional regulator, MarR family n=1 Tax=Vannielia litorea TaxID=1217970 RepID=A0A1N6E804_9RHOB|nr:MarR family transcriptional regulator [Vannielia litorea]SIN79133.1 DNA-binding transcriptional regulator, MarR family [Vannielia litorea]